MKITENQFKASKDISFIKESEEENVDLSTTLLELSNEQKLLLLYTMKNCMNKNVDSFNKLLENQSDDVLNSILNLQNSFLDQYSQNK